MNERRHHERYAVVPNLLLVFNSHPVRLGTVKDISKDGLAFEFTYAASWKENSGDMKMVEIIDYDSDFSLSEIPCKVIYGVESDGTDMPSMRCGLQFYNLTEEHRQKLDYIIAHYTTALLKDGGS